MRVPLHLTTVALILAAVLYPDVTISATLLEIPGLFNTGVDNNGMKLGDGVQEIHYDLSGEADQAFVISDTSKPGEWAPSRGQSAWIGPRGGGPEDADYRYTLTFDLSPFDHETAVISGSWAADNASRIWLNGAGTDFEKDINGFKELTMFVITSGFIAGKNTLQFRVNNQFKGPTGLLVADLTGRAAAIPIPGAVWLLGSGLIAIIGIRRRMRN